MPSLISILLREQIRFVKPLVTNFSIATSRAFQEALGELGATVVADKVMFHEFDIQKIPAAMAVPVALPEGDSRVVLYLHGGGYVAGSIKYARGFAGVLAAKAAVRVLCIAYRLAPEHPYPAAVADAMSAYQYLLEQGYRSENISLIGESAGGGLVFALCLALKSHALPLPALLIALSPWTDLTMKGTSFDINQKADVCLTAKEIESFAAAYASGYQEDCLVSPLFGDLTDLPPSYIYVGSDEILLDD
ncbi:MAG: alpha/beta hydrolase [Clostridiales bacterium]